MFCFADLVNNGFFFSLFLCYITHVAISHRNGLMNLSNMAIWVNSTHGCLHTQCCRLFIDTDVNIRTCSTSCDGGSGSFNSSSSHSPLSTQLFLYFFTLVDLIFFSFSQSWNVPLRYSANVLFNYLFILFGLSILISCWQTTHAWTWTLPSAVKRKSFQHW